jgi:hypothetical protein
MGLLSKAAAGAAGAVMPVALEGLRASIMAERDARLAEYSAGQHLADREFQSSESQKGREFTAAQTDKTLAASSAEHGKSIASAEKLAKMNTAKTVFSNDKGEMFYMDNGKATPVLDSRTGEPMVGKKDLSDASKERLKYLAESNKAIAADMSLPDADKMARIKTNDDEAKILTYGAPSGKSFRDIYDPKSSAPQGTSITDKVNQDKESVPSILFQDKGSTAGGIIGSTFMGGQATATTPSVTASPEKTKTDQAMEIASSFIKQRPRSNSFFVDAPPRSPLASLKDKPFASREEAMKAIREIYAGAQ